MNEKNDHLLENHPAFIRLIQNAKINTEDISCDTSDHEEKEEKENKQ